MMLGWACLALWGIGAVVWFGLQLSMWLRLQAMIRTSKFAPLAVRKTAVAISRRLQLPYSPAVRVVDLPISPVLCGVGRKSCILLPSEMLHGLQQEAQVAVLSHEMTHWRRRDQWVRLLELIATGFYWWHPAVWWVRRRLENAEEQCCDAYVVHRMGVSARTYAEAILDIVDLVSEGFESRRGALTSPIARRPGLKHRLTALMEDRFSPTLQGRSRRILAVAGVCFLCLHPTWFVGANERPVAPSANDRPNREGQAHGNDDQIERRTLENLAWSELVTGVEWSSEPYPSRDRIDPADSGANSRSHESWATALSPNGAYRIDALPGRRCELGPIGSGETTSLAHRGITCCAFSPDSSQFVTGDERNRLILWSTETGADLRVLDRPDDASSPLCSVDFSPHGNSVAAGGEDGRVRIINLSANDGPPTIWQTGSSVRCVRYSPSGEHLAIA
ncbi:MAG: M56 family metallopeptidase, partial [Planctomycetota bacterium]